MSEAATRIVPPSAALTVSSAVISPDVPARRVEVRSRVSMSARRSSAVCTTPAFSRSANGAVVVHRKQPSRVSRSMPVRQSRAAATAMVRVSSSQLPNERSPWATMIVAGANQPMDW